jgi:protein-S-isoprenylcysteine O-methyltransferase Ste14
MAKEIGSAQLDHDAEAGNRCFAVGWIGLWVAFGRSRLAAIVVGVAVVLGVALFVQLYEEPTLRKMFGEDYQEYCRNVRRWLPRMRAWEK